MTRPQRSTVQARNWAAVQADSVFVGIVTAAGTFLPVFLVRLGGSGTAVALLTAIPALTAFALAIPFGRWLQARRNIVPWYSALRMAAWLSYAVMALVAALVPAATAVPAMLVVWAVASLPSTAGLVAFPIVMDGAAGPDGRFDLLGRRWAIAGVSTSISVALGGQLLNLLAFPMNFEVLLVAITLAGVGSFLLSRRIELADQSRPTRPVGPTESRGPGPEGGRGREGWRGRGRWGWRGRAPRLGLADLRALVVRHPAFIRYELRALVFGAGVAIAAPLLPLFYVNEVHAPDAWIGVIGSAQAAGGVLGYVAARRFALRRSGAGVLLPSLIAVAMVPVLLALVGWLPVVAMLAFVYGLATAGAQLALFDQLMRRMPAEHGVTFSSVDQTVQNVGLIVAPNLGGLLAATVGVRPGLVVAGCVIGLAFGWFAVDQDVGTRAPKLVAAVTSRRAGPR